MRSLDGGRLEVAVNRLNDALRAGIKLVTHKINHSSNLVRSVVHKLSFTKIFVYLFYPMLMNSTNIHFSRIDCK